jgi:lipooligosaccharide transport system permease protein
MRALRLSITRRFFRVWRRNLKVYSKIWKISFVPPLLEPLFYLFAFGAGLGAMVGVLTYRGMEISYVTYLAPALIAINMMYNAFFENSYSSFVRMYYQKTYDAMMSTPLSLEEVITGEIFWGATKSAIATAIMAAVVSVFGLLSYPSSLLLLPLAFLGGFAFGAVAMFFTSLVPNIETFNLPIFLFITPMFLFSGTFFPLDNLPGWARIVAGFLPLTHVVRLARACAYAQLQPENLWSVLYLVVFSGVFFLLALIGMRRRLIK